MSAAQSAVDIESVYDELTDGRALSLRVSELVYKAAQAYPGLVPTRADIDAERLQDKVGLEVEQGLFVSRVLGNRACGEHLIAAMSQPKVESLSLLNEFERVGSVDLGVIRLDRVDRIGHVTLQNHSCLNAEDDEFTSALEVARVSGCWSWTA